MMLHAATSARSLLRPAAAALRALSCCAAETGGCEVEGVVPPQPGSVSEYHQHLLVQLPRPDSGSQEAVSAGAGGAWWPRLVEKEPGVVAAFVGLAKYGDHISGKVKVTAFDEVAPGGQQAPPGGYTLLAFPAGLRFGGLSLEQLGLAAALATADNPSRLLLQAGERKVVEARAAPAADLTLLVCCHAAHDSRCGQLGPPLAAALRRLVRQRGMDQHVQVLQTSHVGGHKYAGNVVAYGAMHPCDGDWFGGVHAGNAPQFLDALLGVELGVDGGAGDPALRPFWRGRMGLSKEEQLDLFQKGGAIEDLAELGSETEEEAERGGLGSSSSSSSSSLPRVAGGQQVEAEGDVDDEWGGEEDYNAELEQGAVQPLQQQQRRRQQR